MPGSAGLSGSVAESFLNVQVTTGVPYFDAVNTTVPAGCSALPSSFQSSGMSTIFTWVPAGMVHVPVFVGSNPWTGLPSAVAVTFFSSAAYAPASGRPDPSLKKMPMTANQWKRALFSHSEGENTRTSAGTEYSQQYNARQRKTNWRNRDHQSGHGRNWR